MPVDMQIVMEEVRVIIIRPYGEDKVMTAMMVLPSGRHCCSRDGGPFQNFIHCSFQALYEWSSIGENYKKAETANFNKEPCTAPPMSHSSWDFGTLPSLLMLVRLSGVVELDYVLQELQRSANVWNPEAAQSDILVV